MSTTLTLGRGEVVIEIGWVSESDKRRALFIEPSDVKGEIGKCTDKPARFEMLHDGGVMLIIENSSGARVLVDQLLVLIDEMEKPVEDGK